MITYRFKKVLSALLIMMLVLGNIFIPITDSNTGLGIADVSAAPKKTSTSWPKAPTLHGESAILIDASTGTILYDKKCNKKMYPASITKIMTALLTIENCKLDETVVFSKNAINGLEYGDANAGCQIGEKLSVKDCLYALMLTSANEVATALGEHIAGSTKEFAEMMNERAKKAGATGVHFANANGLHDPNHYVTAYGMAMIMRDALKYQTFRDIINTSEYTIKKNNKRKENFNSYQRHKMVRRYSGFYYDGIIGGKTGFTNQSGTTLVTSAERNGMTLITVVLNSNGNNVYYDTKALLDYGFDNFHKVNVAQNDSRFQNTESVTLKSPFCNDNSSISIDDSACVVIPKKAKFADLTSEISFGISNDKFATITYKYGSKSVGTAGIKYTNTVADTPNESSTTSVAESGTTNLSSESVQSATALDTENKTATANSDNSKKSNFKVPKILLPIIIGIVIVVILILIIVMQHRRLNKIRANKRNRNR